jgi:hypothetical protein
MSWKPTLWIFILVVVTALFILVFDRPADSTARVLPVDAPLLPMSPAAATRLGITAGEVVIECVRREGQWVLTRPEDARADEARIKQILEALGAGRIKETLTPERLAERRLTSASFGLDAPRARLLVGNESQVDEILVGDESPLGDLVYLRLKTNADVIGATLKVSDILPVDVAGMRDHSLFPADLKRVTRLEMKHSGGFLQLALRDGQWRIQQPIEARADNRRVDQLIQSLMSLKVEAFGALAASADPAVYGLSVDEALMQITLTPEGGRPPLVLTVGKLRQDRPDLIYARMSDVSAICSIQREVLAFQTITAESLRDRRLCHADPAAIVSIMLREGDAKLVLEKQEKSGWIIREPFQFKADSRAVGALLMAICNLKMAEPSGSGVPLAPGVTPPVSVCRLVLASRRPLIATTNMPALLPDSKDTSWSYRFEVPPAQGANSQVYCEETRMVTEVPSQELISVWPQVRPLLSLGDPRPYMDCRMLDFSSDQVRRVTLARNGREETVSVGSDGSWLPDSPPDGQLRKGAIPELLILASSLRAERIESMNATNVLAYGIDESSTRVTFGLTGASGILKTVLIGGPCGTNGVYSMIQGQDVVFVLNKERAQALSRPLVEPR